MNPKRKAQVILIENLKFEKGSTKNIVSSTSDRQKTCRDSPKKRKLKTPAAGVDGKGYKGAKGQDGTLQLIINHIPPHKEYAECCAGSAALFHNKKRADRNLLIELNYEQGELLYDIFYPEADVRIDSFYDVLPEWLKSCKDPFLYFDVPYMLSTRFEQRKLYACDWSDKDHVKFLQYVTTLAGKIMISHPNTQLYEKYLGSWNRVEYEYMSHKGLKWDAIWFNYPVPKVLHEYTFIGKDRTDRQRINRRINNLLRKISALPEVEKNKFLELAKQKIFMQ